MQLTLDALFTDPVVRAARAAQLARWRDEGYHDGRSLAGVARNAARESPQTRLVIVSPERPDVITLAEWYQRAQCVAAALAQRGVGKGDVVAVQLPNSVEAAVVYVAAACLGAIVVPIVHLYGPADTDWVLARVRPRVYVVPTHWDGRDYAAPRLAAQPAVADVAVVVTVGDALDGCTPWSTLADTSPAGFEPAAVGGDEPLIVTFTSGTTAEPKGIVHTHHSVLAELRSMPSPPTRYGAIRTMQPWPAGHIGGLTAILGPLVHHLDTYLLDRWDTDAVIELIRAEGIAACSGVPTTVLRLLDQLDATGTTLGLREVTSGGAGVPVSLVERGRRHGWHIARCYGSTEHPSATANTPDDSLAHCTGDDGGPMAGTEIRIVADDGSPCPLGVDGEIALIGPEQMLGYTDPALNAAHFTADGWLLTGDIGRLDADGHLRVTDRRKDLIIRGGENISAVEVEEVLLRHPSVAEAAAVAAPDPHYGERVAAVVRLHPATALTLAEVREHFRRAGVSTVKTPELLEIVDDYPRTASGKIQKRLLREQLHSRQESS